MPIRPILDPLDNADDSSQDINKFYTLKITGSDTIGNKDVNGEPQPYYSAEDIGILQSTALNQPLNSSEFTLPGTGTINTEYQNFLNGGTLTLTVQGLYTNITDAQADSVTRRIPTLNKPPFSTNKFTNY